MGWLLPRGSVTTSHHHRPAMESKRPPSSLQQWTCGFLLLLRGRNVNICHYTTTWKTDKNSGAVHLGDGMRAISRSPYQKNHNKTQLRTKQSLFNSMHLVFIFNKTRITQALNKGSTQLKIIFHAKVIRSNQHSHSRSKRNFCNPKFIFKII